MDTCVQKFFAASVRIADTAGLVSDTLRTNLVAGGEKKRSCADVHKLANEQKTWMHV